MQKITPCLWFEKDIEEAVNYYVSVFKNSKINKTDYFPAVGKETHGQDAGAVMTIEFTLDGQDFLALNGGPGPGFKFNEAVSFIIDCADQEEVDYFTEKLSAVPESMQCGWVKDRFGISWQITPRQMNELMQKGSKEQTERVFAAMMEMKKLDIAALQAAFDGK